MRKVLMLAAFALCGCDSAPPTPLITPTVSSDPSTNIALQTQELRISELENHTEQLDNRLEALLPDTVYLPIDDHGFAAMYSSLGMMTVSVNDVRAFATGSRIQLEIGNLTGASLSRFTMHLAYGSPSRDGSPAIRRERDYTSDAPLYGGRKHIYLIDLADVPPARLSFVALSGFNIATVSLSPQ